MNCLLDTNAWIGFFEGQKGFGAAAKAVMIEEPAECRISVCSIWEAAIKIGIGKLSLPYDLGRDLPDILDENGFDLLDLDIPSAASVAGLETIHRDPFDRIQVAQARRHGLAIVSSDPVFERYGLRRIWDS